MPSYAPWYPEYKIVSGWNNASTLRSIESIIPSNDKPFPPPNAYSGFDAGQAIIRGDGQIYLAGFGAFSWAFKGLTRAQYQYLMATYSTGGNSYSGKVTVRSRIQDGTFANYNAILLLPKLPELQRTRTVYQDVEIRFTRLVAL